MTAVILTTFMMIILSMVYSIDESNIGLDTIEMIEKHGYMAESHYITTEDGYILTYHRIHQNKKSSYFTTKPPVLLMHGLMSSSADYVNMGPNHSLAYILADLGYDVWIGNARGNTWSRNHVELDVKIHAKQFFNFSFHEIGYYDLPAAIDYILKVNGDNSLYYIGHSQGGTSFIVLASTRPEYNKKIKVALLMGPAIYLENHNHMILKIFGTYIYEIEKLFLKLKLYELPLVVLLRALLQALCSLPETEQICLNLMNLHEPINYPQMEYKMLPVILSNAPSHASAKQFYHYGQLIKNGGFRQYDYGKKKNLEIYGIKLPPSYDLSKITAPVGVYYGKNDSLVPHQNVKKLIKNLSNCVEDYLVPYDDFNHLNFIFSKYVIELLYTKMIKLLEQY